VRAARYAADHGIPGAAGSDSHRAAEIGAAWVEMDDFDGPEAFVAALARGTAQGALSGHLVHVWTRLDVIRNTISRRIRR